MVACFGGLPYGKRLTDFNLGSELMIVFEMRILSLQVEMACFFPSSNHPIIGRYEHHPEHHCMQDYRQILIVPFNHRIASYHPLNVGVMHCISAMCQRLRIYTLAIAPQRAASRLKDPASRCPSAE